MLEILEFVFRGFWTFAGCLVFFGGILKFILIFYNRTWRHWNIRKHGYPPAHCDADGDFPPKDTIKGKEGR